MEEESAPQQAITDVADIIEIRDPDVDVATIMMTIRQNVAERRAQGAYKEDVDAIAAEVFSGVLGGTPGTMGQSDDLAGTLRELNERWLIREMPFQSGAPVLGRAIVAVRRFWNWMSTKWYVRAILQQLVSFNAVVVRAVHQLAGEQQALAGELEQLRALCEQQQAEITLLRAELRQLAAARAERQG